MFYTLKTKWFILQEITDLLSGALSSEDEESVEAELNELIFDENKKAMEKLPVVPLDDLSFNTPGNNLKVLHSLLFYQVLKFIFIIQRLKRKKNHHQKRLH